MNILIFGYYNHDNLGDELFKDAFKHLFPFFNFTFTDHLSGNILKDFDIVFIGGGSFLFSEISPKLLEILKTKQVFYIGVGSETEIHSSHLELFKFAKLIAIRNSNKLEEISKINQNTIVIPDIVYALQRPIINQPINKSILIFASSLVVPNFKDPYWKHVSWNYFKSEFAQWLNELIDDNFTVDFLPLCENEFANDKYAAIEIINHMQHKPKVLDYQKDIYILDIISKYSVVISQRFHGIVLSNMAEVPVISIHHHDKLKNTINSLSYYETNKASLYKALQYTTINSKFIPINQDIFKDLSSRVCDLLGQNG